MAHKNDDEERHPGDGDFDVMRRRAGKYYSYILDLRKAVREIIDEIEAGDRRDDEDCGTIYTRHFGKGFLDELKSLLEDKEHWVGPSDE